MNKIVLGSANFGMDYGYLNAGKQLSSSTVRQLLDFAWLNGIDTIDTASVYGNSESVIGSYLFENTDKDFNIISKVNVASSDINKILLQSIQNLNKSKIYAMLVHNFAGFLDNKSIFNDLLAFKESGKCKKIGFSFYYPEELAYIFDNEIPIDIVQVPYSICDRRFESFFPLLHEKNIEIHIRSVFLQGLYFKNPNQLNSHFDSIKSKLQIIQDLSINSGISISSIALNFVNSNNYVDKIVLGVENLDNLQHNLTSLDQKEEFTPFLSSLSDLQINDIDILFPHHWKL